MLFLVGNGWRKDRNIFRDGLFRADRFDRYEIVPVELFPSRRRTVPIGSVRMVLSGFPMRALSFPNPAIPLFLFLSPAFFRATDFPVFGHAVTRVQVCISVTEYSAVASSVGIANLPKVGLSPLWIPPAKGLSAPSPRFRGGAPEDPIDIRKHRELRLMAFLWVHFYHRFPFWYFPQ